MNKNTYEAIKRIFDFVFSFLALIVSSPVWLIISIGIKLSSKGPVFYKSARVGKDLKEFTCYKFRSMHVYDPSKDLIDEKNNRFVAKDYRIFKFGSFLRKSKLDELPQLLNIIASQMSIIGPRPMQRSGAERLFTGKYSSITDVKPGLAALDSLFDYAHGELFISDNVEYQKSVLPIRTELAKMYVDRRSIRMDIYCIIRTLKLIFDIVVLHKRKFEYTKYEKIAVVNVAMNTTALL